LLRAHLNRAVLLGQKKDWVGSNAEFEDVLLLDPEKVEIYGELAANDMLAEDYVKAAETLERGRAAGFQSASHYYSLGARLCKNKDYEAGAAAFGTALEIDPALARAERSLAACLEGQGQTADAIKHLERYLELAPEAPDAKNVAQKIEYLKKS
jgi:tetratricopeptide (TPR) repeat protein